jgi:carbonic anhydrase
VTTAHEALRTLQDGNGRFASGQGHAGDLSAAQESASGDTKPWTVHEPIAAVLGCSDARVPVEVVFDCLPGDLFVVRVAGNTAGPSQIGSLEFAAGTLGVRLLIVLGHAECGAVSKALDVSADDLRGLSPAMQSILEPIVPSAREGPVEEAVRRNVRASIKALSDDSELLARLVADGDLEVRGAVYDLQTRRVEFLAPDAAG